MMTNEKIIRTCVLASICADLRRAIKDNTPPDDAHANKMLMLLEEARKNLETHIIETLADDDIDLSPGYALDRPAIEGQLDLGDIEIPMAVVDRLVSPETELPSPPRKKRGRPVKKKTR